MGRGRSQLTVNTVQRWRRTAAELLPNCCRNAIEPQLNRSQRTHLKRTEVALNGKIMLGLGKSGTAFQSSSFFDVVLFRRRFVRKQDGVQSVHLY